MWQFIGGWIIFLLPGLLSPTRDLSPLVLAGSGCAALMVVLIADAMKKRRPRLALLFTAAAFLLFFEFAYAIGGKIANQPVKSEMLLDFDLDAAWKLYPEYLLIGIACWMLAAGVVTLMFIRQAPKPMPRLICLAGIPLCLITGFLTNECYSPIRKLFTPCPPMQPAAYKAAGIQYCEVNKDNVRAQAGKNIVIIFLESFENTFLDEKMFPGLVPNLQKMSREGVVFSNVKNAPGADYTFTGIYASSMGIPLVPQQVSGPDLSIKKEFGQNMPSLFSILNSAGYRQFFGKGVNLAYTSTDVFLERERVDEFQSFYCSYRDRLPANFNGWGCPDRILFNWGLEKFQDLFRSRRPFAMTLQTVDTHPPAGYIYPDSLTYRWHGTPEEQKMLSAIHNTDRLLGQFIDALKKSECWPNTCVVLTSDHIMPHNGCLNRVLSSNPDRRHIAIVLNSGKPPAINPTPGNSCDLAPTILSIAGVRHNYSFPLGIDLTGTEKRLPLQVNDQFWTAAASYTDRFSAGKPPFRELLARVQQKKFWELIIAGKHYPVPLDYDGNYPFDRALLVLSLKLNRTCKQMYYAESSNEPQADPYAVLFGHTANPQWKDFGIQPTGGKWTLAIKERDHYRTISHDDLNQLALKL